MITIVDEDQIARTKAEELISDITLIAGVKGIHVDVYRDSFGDPSLQLTFRIDKRIGNFDRAFMARFLDFSGEVQTKILHSDVNRFPYTRLEKVA